MAFKIPLIQTKSLSKGYFEGLPNFVWSDVKDKDEIGKGSFGSVMKGNYIPNGKVVVVKRFFGEGDSHLQNIAKEAKMLKGLCHLNIMQYMGVCSKRFAIMMEYEYFDFTPFSLPICKSFCTPLIASRVKLKPLNIFCQFFRRLQRRSW